MKWFMWFGLCCMACNDVEKNENSIRKITLENNSDSIKYHMDYFYDMTSGTYEGMYGHQIVLNLCFYKNSYTKSAISQKKVVKDLCEEYKKYKIELQKKLKDESEESIKLYQWTREKNPRYLPDSIKNPEGETEKIEYKDLDSIPRVYYEIINVNKWDKPKVIGKLYLIYENEFAGKKGKRIYISDTTSQYGVFLLETIMRDVHTFGEESIFEQSKVAFRSIDRFNDMKGLSDRFVTPPYRLIRDEEVNLNKK